MRKSLLLSLLFIATTPLLAEPPEEDILRPRLPTRGSFFIGFDVGMNISWFDGNPIYRAFFESEEESQAFRSAFGIEPFGGFYLGMRVSPSMRVRFRGDYDVRVADRETVTIDQCPLHDAVTGEVIGTVPVDVEKTFSLEIAYLTLSLVGEYHMGQAFLFAGPSLSRPLSRTFTETDRIVDPNSLCTYFADTPDTTRQIVATASGTDNLRSIWGVTLGVGYKIDMSSDLQLVPQIGAHFPFGSALQTDEDYTFRGESPGSEETITTRLNRHMYFRALQASIGLRYSF
jgi:hypothetical protein